MFGAIVGGTLAGFVGVMMRIDAGSNVDQPYRPVSDRHVLLGVISRDPRNVERAESVLANDDDTDGGALTIVSVTQPEHGAVTIDGDQVHFEPELDFSGLVTFTYTITDPDGGTATATVTISVVSDPDDDDDGLSDELEIGLGTDKDDADSDDDGIWDGAEIGLGTDPLNPDTDGGGVSDGLEDVDHDGQVDPGERDPNVGGDDFDDGFEDPGDVDDPDPIDGETPDDIDEPLVDDALIASGNGACDAGGGAGGASMMALALLGLVALRRRRRSAPR
jgi:uncharacterized protein (TIGR03382 family)